MAEKTTAQEDTAIAQAMVMAERKSQESRLLAIARRSLEKWPSPAAKGARRDFIIHEVEDANLAFFMMMRKQRSFVYNAIDDLVESVREEKSSGVVSSHDIWNAGYQKGGVPRGTHTPAVGQAKSEIQGPGADSLLSRDAALADGRLGEEATQGTQPSVVPPPADADHGLSINQRGKHAASARLASKLSSFAINGVLIKSLNYKKMYKLHEQETLLGRRHTRNAAILAKLMERMSPKRPFETTEAAWRNHAAEADLILSGDNELDV